MRATISIWILAMATVLAGENLVLNSDFSEGLKHWKATFPEPNETKYSQNHEWVSVVDGELTYTFPNKVAASQGVKVCTEMIEVDPEKDYEFGAEIYTAKPSIIIFLEGYVKDPEYTEAGNDRYPGFVRVYRHKIITRVKRDTWTTVSQVADINKRPRNAPTHVLLKLYSFHPAGTVKFRQVFLREAKAE